MDTNGNISPLTATLQSLDLSITSNPSTKSIEIKELENRYQIFNICFDCLKNIKPDEKIWIDNDIMVIDESLYYNIFLFQSINRYINNQGRENLFTFIDIKFTEYVRYLDNIKEQISDNLDNKLFKKILQDNLRLIDNLIPGLDTLKTTYQDYNHLSNKISSIILTFIDFKDILERRYNIT